MGFHSARRCLPGILAAALGATLMAQEIPVANWTVPPYRSPAEGLSPMFDVTQGTAFVAVTPCRVVDTRGPVSAFGGPALNANVTRVFDIDNGPCTGLPSGVEAYSLNFGAILPPANGFLTAWASNTSQPDVSQLNMIAGQVVANAAVVPAGNDGAIGVLVNVGPTHIYIDINGYFANYLNDGNALFVVSEVDSSGAIYGHNTSFTANASGVRGTVGPPLNFLGCCGPSGVKGESTHVGVIGLGKDIGVAGRVYDSMGFVTAGGDLAVPASASVSYGVQGASLTSAVGSAGVRGVDYSGDPSAPGTTCCSVAGVRGSSISHNGVVGVTRDVSAVVGFNLDGAGNILALGALGVNDTLGVYFQNGLAGTGTKSFVEPHPTDASKAIRYVSLEGNEAGTYFRGHAKFERGVARIIVPEDFRLVTDPEGLTVQITPIGEMASCAVVRAGLDEVVVKASRNVEFYYQVHGVRRAYRNWQSIVPAEEFFMPESAEQKMPTYLGEEERRRLISNGTYYPDGTVNLETAERLGWTRTWERRRIEREATLARTRAGTGP